MRSVFFFTSLVYYSLRARAPRAHPGALRGGRRAEACSQRAVDRPVRHTGAYPPVCLCLIHSQRCVRNRVAKSAASMSARAAESAREAEFRRS